MGIKSVYSKNEWLLLVALAAVTLGSALCASLQAPFYPLEAEKKGASATEYGMVFGIFELTSFISCPIFGKYMGQLGVGRVLKSGTVVAGLSLISFGFLTFIENHIAFISLSFLIRIIEGLGTAAVITSSVSITVAAFSDTFGRIFTMLEICQGLGFMLGPSVGGYLFEIGGFLCPFMAVGVFVLLNGVFIFFTLPKIEGSVDAARQKTSMISLLKLVPVLIDSLCLVVVAFSLGFAAATLEPHLRQFNLSTTALGGVFTINCIVYMLVSPLVGFMCDRHLDTKKMMISGSVVTVVAFMCIGPMPFTPWDTTLWLVCIGLVLFGVGAAFMLIPAFVDAINSSIKYGLPDDITTYALVSGLFGSSFALGGFIGPSVAGILYDRVGFRPATLLVVMMHAILIIAMGWFLSVQKGYDRRHIIGTTSHDDKEFRDPATCKTTCLNENETNAHAFNDVESPEELLALTTETTDDSECNSFRQPINASINHVGIRSSQA